MKLMKVVFANYLKYNLIQWGIIFTNSNWMDDYYKRWVGQHSKPSLELIDFPSSCKPISNNWALKVRRKASGSNKLKAVLWPKAISGEKLQIMMRLIMMRLSLNCEILLHFPNVRDCSINTCRIDPNWYKNKISQQRMAWRDLYGTTSRFEVKGNMHKAFYIWYKTIV